MEFNKDKEWDDKQFNYMTILHPLEISKAESF